MNENKICFISCVNDHQLYKESLYYINQLEIPEGFEIECICVEDAISMTQGYNKAMKESDAKYKVYLHQDVYIINKSFIRDVLDIFNSNDEIGMLGMAGAKTIPTNGVWWESIHKYGEVYESHTGKMELLQFNKVTNDYEEVKVIDGLIIITQYDIHWREDLFDGWHFYDVSQSVEFTSKGYKVVIPEQDEVWCIHDCGILNIKNGYEHYRDVFLEEYSKFIYPLVSILIPTYNRPKYLKLALESVLNQTYGNIEIIIGDDSTNKETERLIKENYLNKYDNIKYYHNETNLGQFDNDIKLYDMANGQYINYLMDDDLFEATKIQKMMNYFVQDKNEEISLVTSHRGIIDGNGNYNGIFGNTEKIFESDTVVGGIEMGNELIISHYNFIGEPTTVLFRKKALIEPFGVFNGKKYGPNIDQASWLNLLSEGKAVYINEVLSYFRIHKGQQQHEEELIFQGQIDHVHKLLTCRNKNFMKKDEDYIKAIDTLIWHLNLYLDHIKDSNDNLKRITIEKSYNKLLEVREKIENSIKEKKPLVSVLIPAYNQTKYLKEALESAINQTYSNIEIIIGDDSSTDEVEIFIKPYVERYRNISYYKNERDSMDYGISNTQELLRKSKGEYINYLYHDDVFEATKIEKMMKYYLNSNDVTLVTSHRQLIDENGNFIADSGATQRLFNEDKLLDGIELGRCCLNSITNYIGEATTVLLKKSLILNELFKFNNNTYLNIGDLAMWLSLLNKGRAVYISESLSYFRRHSSQNTFKPEIFLLGVIEWKKIIYDSYEIGFIYNYEEYKSLILKWFNTFNYLLEGQNSRNVDIKLADKLKYAFKEVIDICFDEKESVNTNKITNIYEDSKKYKIVFLTQAPSVWSATESVWKAFNQDANCETEIIQLPFYNKDFYIKDQLKIGDYLVNQNVKFQYWYETNLRKKNPDVVFFQNSYDEIRSSNYNVENVSKICNKIVYIPYAFEIIKKWPGIEKDYIEVISESNLIKKSWKIFLRSNRSKYMYEKFSLRGNKHMVVSGHPKIDYVVNYKKSKLDIIKDSKKYSIIKGRKIILWNPNISEFGGQDRWTLYFDILGLIEKYNNVIFIIRPHPLQLIKLKDNNISDDCLFEKFKNKLNKLDNIILDDSPDYREAFTLSDALITCSSSLIFEYLATKKPILHMPQAYEAELNEDGEILSYLYKGEEIKQIDMFFNYIFEGKDPLKNVRMKIISEFLYAIDGKNGERIKEYIINKLKKEKK